MFRKMRRHKQQLSQEETAEILKTGRTAVLGILGDDGYPYTVPINYVYADGKVYFHGARSGHKLDAIRRCAKVSLCVIEKDNVGRMHNAFYPFSVYRLGKCCFV